MRNERASQPFTVRPKYRCLADSTIDEVFLSAGCRSMARCADAAVDGLHGRIRDTAISQLRLHLASRTELHVQIGRPWSRSAAERWTDRAWNGYGDMDFSS
jgi:hypothetical protein